LLGSSEIVAWSILGWLPGNSLKFTIVLLYAKLVFISQRLDSRFRPVSSTPLYIRL